MLTSRPLFSFALSVLFGEMLFCPELPRSLRFLFLLLYLFYLHLLLRKKKLKILLLSLFLFLFSSFHFQDSLSYFQKQQERVERVLALNCAVVGTITSVSENDSGYRFILKNCLCMSSLGKKPGKLSTEQEKKWNARNNLPFRKVQVLLKKTSEDRSELPAVSPEFPCPAASPCQESSPCPSSFESPFYPGDRVLFRGKFMELSPAMNEGEFSFLQHLKAEGIEAFFLANRGEIQEKDSAPFLKLLYKIRKEASRNLEILYPKTQSDFLKSLFLGEKTALSREERNLYQEAGIAHILAVSGLHLSLVGGACFILLRIVNMEISLASLISSFFVFSFALFTGASGSTLRAMIMFFITFLGKNLGRGQDRISSLSLALVLLLFWQPLFLYSVGFQCSFYSLFLLLLLSLRDGKEARKAFRKKWEKAKKKKKYKEILKLLPKKLKEGGKELILFYLGLFPLFSFLQYSLPLYAPVLNLLLLPLLPFIFLLGVLSLIFLHFPPLLFLAKFLSRTLSILLQLFHQLIQLSLHLPYSSILLGKISLSSLFLFIFLFYLFFLFPLHSVLKRKSKIGRERKETEMHRVLSFPFTKFYAIKANPFILKNIFSFLFLCSMPLFLPSPPKNLEITAIYVGQGDGFLIRKGNFVLTIDNGSSSNKNFPENTLLPYCKAKRIKKIQYALITHSDIDHTSGIQAILEENAIINSSSKRKTEDAQGKETERNEAENEQKNKYNLQIENLILPVQAEEDHRYDILKRLAVNHGAKLLYWKNGNSIEYGNKISSSSAKPNKKEPPRLSFHCYYPITNSPMEEANAHSLGCLLHYGKFSMIFTGDMPDVAEKEMLSAIKKEGQSPSVDIVKLAHHGSKTSSSPIFLSETKGKFALFSYGKNNRYGHPHKITLEKCSSFKLIPLETAKLGEILIRTDGEEYQIITPCAPP